MKAYPSLSAGWSWLSARRPAGWFLLLAVNLAILCLLVFLLEVSSWAWHAIRRDKVEIRHRQFNYMELEDTLGYRLLPCVSGNILHQVGADTLYLTTVSTDSLRRRSTTASSMAPDTLPYHAIFVGCSFTFGHSVSDHETLPSFFSARHAAYQAYNYGVQGYGTQHLPFVLDRIDREQDIPQQDGFMVYTFIDDHVRRVIGSKQSIWFTHGFPYFEPEDGKPVYKGQFDKDRRLTTSLYQLLWKSEFLKFFKFDLPLELAPEHYRLTAALIRSTADRYRRKFGNDRFFVLIYPGQRNEIVSYLDPDIQVIDLSGAWPAQKWEVDGHPEVQAYSTLADMLADTLRSKGVPGL
jgi:hypothetical protein